MYPCCMFASFLSTFCARPRESPPVFELREMSEPKSLTWRQILLSQRAGIGNVSQKIKTVIKKAVKDLPLSFFPFKREVKGYSLFEQEQRPWRAKVKANIWNNVSFIVFSIMACRLWTPTAFLSTGLFGFFLFALLDCQPPKQLTNTRALKGPQSTWPQKYSQTAMETLIELEFLYRCTFCQLLFQWVPWGWGKYWFKITGQRQTLVCTRRCDSPRGHCFLALAAWTSSPAVLSSQSWAVSSVTQGSGCRWQTRCLDMAVVLFSVWYMAKTNPTGDAKRWTWGEMGTGTRSGWGRNTTAPQAEVR